jgi:hypothetical protein
MGINAAAPLTDKFATNARRGAREDGLVQAPRSRSEGAAMKCRFLMTAAAAAIIAGAMVLLPAMAAAQTPPMGGGYTNVIPIAIDEPATKAIAGALFKPEGAGPFPAVVYLGDCGPIGGTDDRSLEKAVVNRNLSKGFATLILDSFTPRHQRHGVCDRQNNPVWLGIRAADAHAAKDVLASMPDVEPSESSCWAMTMADRPLSSRPTQ